MAYRVGGLLEAKTRSPVERSLESKKDVFGVKKCHGERLRALGARDAYRNLRTDGLFAVAHLACYRWSV